MASQPNDAQAPSTCSRTMVCYFLFWARTQSYQSLGISCAQRPKTLGGTVGPMPTSTVSLHPTFSFTLTFSSATSCTIALSSQTIGDLLSIRLAMLFNLLGINPPRPSLCGVVRPLRDQPSAPPSSYLCVVLPSPVELSPNRRVASPRKGPRRLSHHTLHPGASQRGGA